MVCPLDICFGFPVRHTQKGTPIDTTTSSFEKPAPEIAVHVYEETRPAVVFPWRARTLRAILIACIFSVPKVFVSENPALLGFLARGCAFHFGSLLVGFF